MRSKILTLFLGLSILASYSLSYANNSASYMDHSTPEAVIIQDEDNDQLELFERNPYIIDYGNWYEIYDSKIKFSDSYFEIAKDLIVYGGDKLNFRLYKNLGSSSNVLNCKIRLKGTVMNKRRIKSGESVYITVPGFHDQEHKLTLEFESSANAYWRPQINHIFNYSNGGPDVSPNSSNIPTD